MLGHRYFLVPTRNAKCGASRVKSWAKSLV